MFMPELRRSGMTMFDQISATLTGVADDRPPVVLVHGLSYDRRQWGPLVRELDPGRRVLALDLPGHGQSPRRDSYVSGEVAEVLHRAIEAAGFEAPIVVGHSLGGVLVTVYAARYPTRGVVNVDQPLTLGRFGAVVRAAEPVLRGPEWRTVWDRFVAGMGIDSLPAEVRGLAEDSRPRADLLLGYWEEILRLPDEVIDAQRREELASISVPYVSVMSGDFPDAGHFPHLAHPGAVARIITQSFQPTEPG
ncbi:alpha/beta fold hydrolase [Cryptosporangium sp. NPDC048952]|uniref:alpha/beta fold hydrolase n=1 Tax=Cryptosporangium sp. NPDC048952 TaxID=3363961 RepID=UPI00371EFB10